MLARGGNGTGRGGRDLLRRGGGADFLPSRLGRTLCDYTNGKLRAYVDGGFEFVAARDIVEGHLLCMRHGRSGEKYIFSSEYKTISEILELYRGSLGRARGRAGGFRLRLMLVFSEDRELLPEPIPSGLSPAASPRAPSAC